jgi:UDP-N-acetyl-D-mannosaminuronic acid dehydrogenase
MKFEKIVVMGLGYIGLPTASMLATKGYQVIGVDVSNTVVDIINAGQIHIVEPDLDILVKSAVNSRNLTASLVPVKADAFILAVPTPFKVNGSNSKAPDISYVEAATLAITPFIEKGNLIILESTSPVGTTKRVYDIIVEERPELCDLIYVAHCPERVLPGHILRELVENDRIIGGINDASSQKASDLYRTFCNGNIYVTDCKTAELAKLVENSFRDVNIAFANELSLICDKLDVNVWELIELANKHPRVNILQPGPGVGGHCIAVDPWFIVDSAPSEARLIRTAREVNDAKPEWVVEKVKNSASKFKNPVIGCLGLAFKANIDDLRESPALKITRELIKAGIGTVMPCEPNVQITFAEFPLYSLDTVMQEADILLVLVDHNEFREIDRGLLDDKVVIDTRGIWN